MFGRATITLGIGPHSSSSLLRVAVQKDDYNMKVYQIAIAYITRYTKSSFCFVVLQ